MRLPWTIWKHTLLDLTRQVLVISVVLTAVIAFAMGVKFLAEGKVSPLIALKVMVMATVPMLQYSLPFAAAFAATLVYHRMSQDNELAASYAGGIGHRTLLVPALATGLALSLILLVLSQLIIPRFLQRIEREVSQDAAKIVQSTIEQGRALEFDDCVMIADSVRSLGPHDKTGAYERLLLTGVVFVETDDEGNLIREGSAASGRVYFFSGSDAAALEAATQGAIFGDDSRTGSTLALIELEDGQIRKPGQSVVDVESAPFKLRLGGGIKDDPKFLTYQELRNVPKNPDALAMIDQRRRDLAVHLALQIGAERMQQRLAQHQPLEFEDRAGRRVTVAAGSMRWDDAIKGWRLAPAPSKTIEVQVHSPRADGSRTFSRAKAALLPDIGKDRETRALAFTLDISEASSEDPKATSEQALARLSIVDDQVQALEAKPSSELLATAEARIAQEAKQSPATSFLANPTRDLRTRIARLLREVLSKHHERFALSAACLVMVLTGAVTAMRLGPALPLVVYLWCFFPALVAVITIAMGQQLTHHQGYAWLILLWAGVAGLFAYSLAALRVVGRH